MHKYYFYKDKMAYVMDEDKKLYRYLVTNNLNMILEIENLIKFFETELNEEDTRFAFPTYGELDIINKTNIVLTFLNFSLIQYIILNKNGIVLSILEFLLIRSLNHEYQRQKEYNQNNNELYRELLEITLKELNEKLINLKEISHCKKENVSYAYLEPNTKKYYLRDIKTLAGPYSNEIFFEYDINIIPNKLFSDSIPFEYLGDIYTKEEQDKIYEERRKLNIYKKHLPKEIEEKITYIKLNSKKEILFHIKNGSLAIPCIIEIIKQQLNISYLDEFQKVLIIIIIIEEISCEYFQTKTEKSLEKVNNPLLTLRKKK